MDVECSGEITNLILYKDYEIHTNYDNYDDGYDDADDGFGTQGDRRGLTHTPQCASLISDVSATIEQNIKQYQSICIKEYETKQGFLKSH